MGTFAQSLRALLDERGLSQAELARRLDLSPQAVSTWITGATTPSRINVVRLEDEFAVNPRGWLLKLAGYSSSDENEPDTPESAIRRDPGLHPEDKRVLLRIIALARQRFEPE